MGRVPGQGSDPAHGGGPPELHGLEGRGVRHLDVRVGHHLPGRQPVQEGAPGGEGVLTAWFAKLGRHVHCRKPN